MDITELKNSIMKLYGTASPSKMETLSSERDNSIPVSPISIPLESPIMSISQQSVTLPLSPTDISLFLDEITPPKAKPQPPKRRHYRRQSDDSSLSISCTSTFDMNETREFGLTQRLQRLENDYDEMTSTLKQERLKYANAELRLHQLEKRMENAAQMTLVYETVDIFEDILWRESPCRKNRRQTLEWAIKQEVVDSDYVRSVLKLNKNQHLRDLLAFLHDVKSVKRLYGYGGKGLSASRSELCRVASQRLSPHDYFYYRKILDAICIWTSTYEEGPLIAACVKLERKPESEL